VITCGPENNVEDVMREMTSCRIRHLPVVADGALVGIVSIGDVVKNRVDELEMESSMLRNYLVSR
jgi:CBS domain-containing protein